MKILYLHQYFRTPCMSGGTRSYEMARRFVQAGHEVHIITSDTDAFQYDTRWRTEVIDGINVHWLAVPYSNKMGLLRRLKAFFRFAMKAGPYASSLKGDVVFATSTPLTIAFPGIFASRKLKIPLVFEVRDLWPEVPIAMGIIRSPLTRYIARRLESWAYRNSARVVGLSPGMCEGIATTGYSEHNIRCIPNSADLHLFDTPADLGLAFRSKRPWLGQAKLLVYGGTFGRVNGATYLVSLAVAMKEIDSSVRILGVGDGADFLRVKNDAAKAGVLDVNLFLESPIPKAEMPALLSAADATLSLVIPVEALWKNSANKFFDSLAAGRPIIINYLGWQADLLKESGAGFTVFNDAIEEAAQRVVSFLGDDIALARAGESALELAKARFSREKLAQKLIDTLEEVL